MLCSIMRSRSFGLFSVPIFFTQALCRSVNLHCSCTSVPELCLLLVLNVATSSTSSELSASTQLSLLSTTAGLSPTCFVLARPRHRL
ncbi:hypothetical protein Mapa_001572 [Marchantia paleacea]|nr:hypothetical protein Mapa_001572 [Marchantia paleacea]